MTEFKLPAPVWLGDIPGYTESQMRQMYNDALDAAANVTDRIELGGLDSEPLWQSCIAETLHMVADRVRQLKESV